MAAIIVVCPLSSPGNAAAPQASEHDLLAHEVIHAVRDRAGVR
jgi:hypothetical protein